jgi:hypothetical protein
MRRVDPPKLVHVGRDETWHPGWLQAWRRDDDGWLAYVRYGLRGRGDATFGMGQS